MLGKPLNRPIPNEIIWDGEGPPSPGLGWKIPPQVEKEIEAIDLLLKRSMANARNIRVN